MPRRIIEFLLALVLVAGIAPLPEAGAQPVPEEARQELLGRFAQGRDLFKAGQYRKALQTFQSILEVDPQARGSLFLSGMAHLQLMEFEQAAPRFNQFLQLEPEHVSGLIGGIQANQSTGNTAMADLYRQRLFKLKQQGADPRLKIMLSYERETIPLEGGRRLSILERFPGDMQTALFKAMIIESKKTIRTLEWREPEGPADKTLRQLYPESAGKTAFVLGEVIAPQREGEMEDYRMHSVAFGTLSYEQARAGFLKVIRSE